MNVAKLLREFTDWQVYSGLPASVAVGGGNAHAIARSAEDYIRILRERGRLDENGEEAPEPLTVKHREPDQPDLTKRVEALEGALVQLRSKKVEWHSLQLAEHEERLERLESLHRW